MNKHIATLALKRTTALLQAGALVIASMLPALLLNGTASGNQLTNRYIDMSATQASEGSGRDGGDAAGQNVTYTVKFDLATAHTNLEGIVIHFCTDSPIIGDACTDASTNGFSLATPTLSANTLGGATDIDPSGWTVGGDNTDYIIISDATGLAGIVGDTVAFDIDGITNPTSLGSFYARITTFTVDTNATAYTGVATSPGTYIDDGGIALSVARELTITARVQEVLEFCVGTETVSTITPATGDNCTNVAGTDLSLGVVGSSIATTSTITVPNDGVMMIRTNASNGAVMYYKAEQDGSANGGKGALKIQGSDCSLTLTDLDDPCFNSVGTTRAAITAGVERFGLALKERITTTGGATNAVTCDAEYRGDGTAGCTGAVAGNNYAWDDTGVFDTLASSGGPIDDELIALEFAATASPTTPTGIYSVTANFVATSTF